MKCPKCGSLLKDNSYRCHQCHLYIDIDNEKINNNNEFNNIKKENHNNYDYQDQLLTTYIGNNYERLQEGISYWSLLFGVFYLMYRKMWLLGIILFVIFIIMLSISTPLAISYSLILRFILAIKFKRLYYRHAQEKVSIIINNHQDQSIETLEKICSQQGGITYYVFILIGLIIMLLIFIFLSYHDILMINK